MEKGGSVTHYLKSAASGTRSGEQSVRETVAQFIADVRARGDVPDQVLSAGIVAH